MVVLASDKDDFLTKAISRIKCSADTAIKSRNIFNIILAGGETPKSVYSSLRSIETSWEDWNIWFSDERSCNNDEIDHLNSVMADNALLKYVPVKESNIHRIKIEQGVHEAVTQYQEDIRGISVFDITLLGIGEDGHTASLFPGHDLGRKPDSPDVLAVFNAPKKPSQRVTLSIQLLNRSREVLFLVAGEKKRSIVEAYQFGEAMPALCVNGLDNTTLLYCPCEFR